MSHGLRVSEYAAMATTPMKPKTIESVKEPALVGSSNSTQISPVPSRKDLRLTIPGWSEDMVTEDFSRHENKMMLSTFTNNN